MVATPQPIQVNEQAEESTAIGSNEIIPEAQFASDPMPEQQFMPDPVQEAQPEPLPEVDGSTDSEKPKFSKKMKIGMIAAGAVLALLIVLLVVFLPSQSEGDNTHNGKSALDYLGQAKVLANNTDYESLNNAWECFLVADSLEDGMADVSVLMDIISKANSLFNDKIAKGKLTEEETDSAAMFITLSRKIYDTKNDAIMAKIANDTTQRITNFSVEYYMQHFEALSDLYLKQAESAERIWTKYKDDVKEEKLLKYSIQQALLYNPDNEEAKVYKEKYCN